MRRKDKKVEECDICNRISTTVSLADIQIKDNGDYLYITDGENIIETGFTSHNAEIFFNTML